MRDGTTGRGWAAPTATVLACVLGGALLTSDLGDGGDGPPAAVLAEPAPTPLTLSGRAPGPLAALVPAPADWGYGWVADDAAASQQVTDGPGLLHPCGVAYASDAQRLEVSRDNVVQDERDVPAGQAMTVELARYAGDGAAQALRERAEALAACPSYTTTFAGYPGTPVEVALLQPPAGGSSTAAHLAATPSTAVGRQVVEYTYLVAQQGDVLLSAVVGNGNGEGVELDTFAAGYFTQARLRLAGLPAPSPELALAAPAAP